MRIFGKTIFFAIHSLIFWFAVGNCYAEMCKWVDADGQAHYSEKPPAGDVKVTTIKAPPKVDTEKALKELEEHENKLKGIDEERKQKAEEQGLAKEGQDVKEKNCELANDKLSRVTNNPRVYSKDKDGVRYKLGEEERQAKISEARKEIRENCNVTF